MKKFLEFLRSLFFKKKKSISDLPTPSENKADELVDVEDDNAAPDVEQKLEVESILRNKTFTPNFEHAIKIILKHEGGYVNDPVDPGGETKYGISKRQYPNIDIKNLTISDAKDIYYKDYWLKSKADKIKNKYVATKYFDIAVNMGNYRASIILQKAVNDISSNKLVVDGKVGPKTLRLVNDQNHKILLIAIRSRQWRFYQYLMKKNPKLKKYYNGWKRRAFS